MWNYSNNKNNIDEKGNIFFELYADGKLMKCSELNLGFSLNKLTNPTYEVYSITKRVIDAYVEMRGGSALASSSSHYNNALMLLSAISDCASWQEMELWEQKYNEKYKKN